MEHLQFALAYTAYQKKKKKRDTQCERLADAQDAEGHRESQRGAQTKLSV